MQLAQNCFALMTQLAPYIADKQLSQLPQLCQVFETAMRNGKNYGKAGYRIVAEAIRALGHLMNMLHRAEDVEKLQKLIPGIIATLASTLQAKLEVESIVILSVLKWQKHTLGFSSHI